MPKRRGGRSAVFREAADYASEKGIAVGLQNHPSTGEDVLRILEQDRSGQFLRLLWIQDSGSDRLRGTRGCRIRRWISTRLWNRQRHIRPMSGPSFNKIDTGAEAWLDYPRIIQILKDVDFNGTVSSGL